MTVLTVADPGRCLPRRVGEMPRYRLLDLLVEEGVEALLAVRLGHVARRVMRYDPVQALAVSALVQDASLRRVEGWRGSPVWSEEHRGRRISILRPPGDAAADAAYDGAGSGLRGRLLELLPEQPRPVIAVDLGLVERHSLDEAGSLRLQLGALLGVVRRFLWDRHLLLAGLRPGVAEWLRGLMGSVSVSLSWLPSDEALRIRGYRRIILLDPSAPEPLTSSDVLEADAFILGGIVDKVARPGETSRLPLRGFYQPRRLELRGSIHGVPNRINAVAEIILRARYETCGDIEEAIKRTMSRRDARLRAYVELTRWSRGKRRTVPWSIYEQLRSWLPLTPEDFAKAARMAGLEVEGSAKAKHITGQR